MTVIDVPDSMLYDDTPPPRRPGEFYRDNRGTPMVADPVKVRKDGKPWTVKYGRPSSFGKQIENTYNLDKWNERQIVLGVAHGVDCTDLLPAHQDDPEWRSRADGLVVEAKREAKAMLAAERGTHTHLLAELDDEGKHWLTQAEAGEELGIPTDVQARLVEAWRTMLADLGLEIVANEATVVNDTWRLAGTLDRIARLTRDLVFTTAAGEIVTLGAGTTIVLDIKTGKLAQDDSGYPMFWHTYAVQVCAYADSVPYNPDTGERGVWEVQPHSEWAIIAHLDVLAALEGDAVCTPILVDIRAGREAGNLCHAAKQWQRRNDLFGRLHDIKETTCTTTSPTTTAIESSSTTAMSPPAPTSTPATTFSTPTSSLTETERHSGPAKTTSTPTPACSRDALRSRIAELVAAGHEDRLRLVWPQGVAPLSRDGHTNVELARILGAVRQVESDVSATFHPDDTPPPPAAVVDELPPHPVPSPAPDEGGDVDPAAVAALQAAFAALPDAARQAIGAISKEAADAGRSISVTLHPTVRRWSIARALVRWALCPTSVPIELLWDSAADLATPDQTADPDQTLGALLGTFTIEQANRLHDTFDTSVAA